MEEAQLHHNQIMVSQHRVVASFEQLDASLLDTSGYRQLYWEYDSVHFFVQQMIIVLDTIHGLGRDSSLVMAGKRYAQNALDLHTNLYPPFLDAYRKYHALGFAADSIEMDRCWAQIKNQKNQMTMIFKSSQEEFVKKYNLSIYTSI